MRAKRYRAPLSFFLFLTSFYNQNLPKMAGNGGTADEQELQEALRMSLEVSNAPYGAESQSVRNRTPQWRLAVPRHG